MKRNRMTVLLVATGLVLGFGLFLSGCGPNQRAEPAAEAVNESDRVPSEMVPDEISGDSTEASLDSLEPRPPTPEELLDARLEELDRRLASVESRETALDEREMALDDAIPSEPEFEPDFEAEPELEIPAMQPPVEIEPEPRTVMVRLPAATELAIQFSDPVSSEFSLVGDTVRGMVVENVVRRRLVAIPAGSEVTGTVTEVVPGKRIGGQARLTVRFDEVRTPDGYKVGIQSFLEAEGENQRRRDAVTIGGSAAGGAILGRILKDDNRTKGGLIGGLIGAAIGAAVASENHGDPVVFEAGSFSTISLDLPVHVAVLETQEALLARK